MRVFQGVGLIVIVSLLACSRDSTSGSGEQRSVSAPGTNAKSTSEEGAAVTPSASGDASETQPPDELPSSSHAEQRLDHAKDPDAAADAQDERYRRLAVGTWEDDYQGHRTMTLSEDGTGTIVVELSGLKATLFAPRLEFNMEWSIENGRLKKRTISGKPEKRVNMILKMMGDRVDEPILELTEERLLLLDKDGETRYDWRRKKAEVE